MSAFNDLPGAIGPYLGLTSRENKQLSFGMLDQFPSQIVTVKERNAVVVQFIMRLRETGRESTVLQALLESPELMQKGLKKMHLTVANGILTYKLFPKFLGQQNPQEVAALFSTILTVVKSAMQPAPSLACALCSSTSVSSPVLINGLVNLICSNCLDKMLQEASAAQAAYDSKSPNLLLGTIAGSACAAAGGALWAAAAVGTGKMYALLGALVGLMVGWATLKGSGKGGRPVQVLSAVLTLVSLMAGEVLYFAYTLNAYATEQNLQMDWVAFINSIPVLLINDLLEGGGFFVLICGFLGVIYAVRGAGRLNFMPTIQRL